MNISKLNPSAVRQVNDLNRTATPNANPGSVGDTFDQVLNSLSNSEKLSDGLMQKLAAGEDVDLHQVMIAAEETDVNFKVALAIRDQLVDAYREIMRMAV